MVENVLKGVITDSMYNDIKQYCTLNGIDDVVKFISQKLIMESFAKLKFGNSPFEKMGIAQTDVGKVPTQNISDKETDNTNINATPTKRVRTKKVTIVKK